MVCLVLGVRVVSEVPSALGSSLIRGGPPCPCLVKKMVATVVAFAALLVAGIAVTRAQVPALGPCPEIETMKDFSVERYLGQWYEAERYFALFEFAGKCVSANYTGTGDGRINIINKQTSSLTGIRSTIEGEVRLVGRTDESKLSVKFPSLPVLVDAPYWVLGTDYDNYAVVWSCSNFGLFSTRNAWILTRSRHPTLDVMEKAYSVVDKHGISRAYFIRTDQKNCPVNAY